MSSKSRVTSRSRLRVISKPRTSNEELKTDELRENRSVEEILRDIRIRRSDLNNLGPEVILGIFNDLNIIEISKLCSLSVAFNNACKKESLWESKVWSEYGINKMYGISWKETARNLSIANMINMNEVWINGMTYIELLNEAISKGANSFNYIRDLKDEALKAAFGLIFVDFFDRRNSSLTLAGLYPHNPELKAILTKGLAVIAATLKIKDQNYLPGNYGRGLFNIPYDVQNILNDLFDPILYVIQFSSVSLSGINSIIYR